MNDLNKIVVTDIIDVRTVFSPKGRYAKINNRKCYSLSFCNEGQITYTHNKKIYVSDPHHAIILPKGQGYTIRGDKSGVFPVINFECFDFLCDTMILFIKIYNNSISVLSVSFSFCLVQSTKLLPPSF